MDVHSCIIVLSSKLIGITKMRKEHIVITQLPQIPPVQQDQVIVLFPVDTQRKSK